MHPEAAVASKGLLGAVCLRSDGSTEECPVVIRHARKFDASSHGTLLQVGGLVSCRCVGTGGPQPTAPGSAYWSPFTTSVLGSGSGRNEDEVVREWERAVRPNPRGRVTRATGPREGCQASGSSFSEHYELAV